MDGKYVDTLPVSLWMGQPSKRQTLQT